MIYIKERFSATTIVQRSEFIAILIPLTDLKESELILSSLRKEYPKANHYCYAYVFDNYMKFSDDGEPTNTAGKPILNVLLNKHINQAMCVVIRYFGGVKLGAGNLLRTYITSVNNCLDKAIFYEKKELDVVKINLEYKYVDSILYTLEKEKYLIKSKNFFEQVEIIAAKENINLDEIKDLFKGKVKIENIGKEDLFIKI